jgi:hypothetical protein
MKIDAKTWDIMTEKHVPAPDTDLVDFAHGFVELYFNKTRRFRNTEAHLTRAELAALIAVAVEQSVTVTLRARQ